MERVSNTRIYLIGFMGSGKTSVGWRLAKKLGWQFIDLDEEIERGQGRPVAEIFRDHGEARFRQLERECLKRLSSSASAEKSVIALGGGTFLDPENRAVTESTGLTVWLKVSFATVAGRVKIDSTRPKFSSEEQAESLFQSRVPYYALAKMHISTDQGTPEAVADEIAGAIEKS
jgi:shikimate kinase